MKKIVLALVFISASVVGDTSFPAGNITSSSPIHPRNVSRGIINDLTNLPQTLSQVLPTLHTIQKLLLSGAIVRLGYQCCKYGLSHYNKAAKSRWKKKTNEKNLESEWLTFTGSSFIFVGSCLFLSAQPIANFAYRT